MPAFSITPVPALTYEHSSKEQAAPLSEVHEKLSSTKERVGFLELQVSSLQEELA